MKKVFNLLISTIVILGTGCGTQENEPRIDTEQVAVEKLKSEKAYSESILTLNYSIGIQNLDAVHVSDIASNGRQKIQSIGELFSENKKDKFVIRYNQIGCNTCIDLFFKNKELLNQISKQYDILVLVDFKNYQDYIVWKKTSEIETGIYLLNKGDLPFDVRFEENSYCFVINDKLMTSKYFMPNNQFPSYVNKYISDITKS